VLEDVGIGLLIGMVVAVIASKLLPRGRALGHEISPRRKSLYALGVAFGAYAVAVAIPHGNGFVAVFVCAIALGTMRADLRECFENRSGELIEIVKLGIFVVFGSLLTLSALFNDGWAAVGIVAATFVAIRPLSILVSLIGVRLSLREAVHRLVRTQGRRHDGLFAPDPQPPDHRRRADLRHRGAGRQSSHRSSRTASPTIPLLNGWRATPRPNTSVRTRSSINEASRWSGLPRLAEHLTPRTASMTVGFRDLA
jgi:hypothetical protein